MSESEFQMLCHAGNILRADDRALMACVVCEAGHAPEDQEFFVCRDLCAVILSTLAGTAAGIIATKTTDIIDRKVSKAVSVKRQRVVEDLDKSIDEILVTPLPFKEGLRSVSEFLRKRNSSRSSSEGRPKKGAKKGPRKR